MKIAFLPAAQDSLLMGDHDNSWKSISLAFSCHAR
jgi:hypothetical protein